MELPEGAETIGFAEDLALIVIAENTTDFEEQTNQAIEKIVEWMEEKQLELAPGKTEMVVLRGHWWKRKRKDITIRVLGTMVTSKIAVKYLG